MRNGKLPPEITVSTVDSRIMHIARRSGRKFDLAADTARREALHYARNAVKPQTIGDLDQLLLTQAVQTLRDEYLLEEFEWVIEGQNGRLEPDYLQANRAGRGIPFDERLCKSMPPRG